MNNIVVFIAPTVDEAMRQKLAESLRIRKIATTDNPQNATLVITDIPQPVELMNIADFAEKLVNDTIPKVLTMNHEILLINQKLKKAKHELNTQHPLKQFNQKKQIYRQRFFNRTQCK